MFLRVKDAIRVRFLKGFMAVNAMDADRIKPSIEVATRVASGWAARWVQRSPLRSPPRLH